MKRFLIFNVFFLLFFPVFSNEILIPYRMNGNIGFLDKTMKVIQKPKYTNIYGFSKNAADVQIINKDTLYVEQYLFTIFQGEIYLSSSYDDKMYSSIHFISDLYVNMDCNSISEGLNAYTINIKNLEKIDKLSKIALNNSKSLQYIVIDYDGNKYPANTNLSRNYLVDIEGNKSLTNNDFTEIRCFDSESKIGIARISGKLKLFNLDGKFVSDKEFSAARASVISDGLFLAVTTNEQGFFNTSGDLVISINRLSELNLCFHSNVIPCVIENGKIDLYSDESYYSNNWAIVNSKGEIIKNNIQAIEIHEFSEDGTAVLINKKNGKIIYTLINSEGQNLVNEPFDLIEDSINGYCMARKNSIDYLISSQDGTIYNCKDFK